MDLRKITCIYSLCSCNTLSFSPFSVIVNNCRPHSIQPSHLSLGRPSCSLSLSFSLPVVSLPLSDYRNELFSKTVTWRRVYPVFTYILIEKDICDRRNVSVDLMYIYVYLSSGDLFIIFGKSFLFLFLFCVGI